MNWKELNNPIRVCLEGLQKNFLGSREKNFKSQRMLPSLPIKINHKQNPNKTLKLANLQEEPKKISTIDLHCIRDVLNSIVKAIYDCFS